jgi:hypothetical protein
MAAYAYAIGARIAPDSCLGNPKPHG